MRSPEQIPEDMSILLTSRPHSPGMCISWQFGAKLDNSACKTEFIPTLNHRWLDMLLVHIELFGGFIECSVQIYLLLCCNLQFSIGSFRVVMAVKMECCVCVWRIAWVSSAPKLWSQQGQLIRLTIVFVESSPPWVVAIVQCSAFLFELIRENLKFASRWGSRRIRMYSACQSVTHELICSII